MDEPSVVALDRRTEKMIAVGGKAKMMYEKTNPDIRTIRPLRDGVIANFNACVPLVLGFRSGKQMMRSAAAAAAKK